MSSETRFDDGCSSGDDLEYYERGMPPRPPRYSLSFSCVRRQNQRLTNADKRLIGQWFYPLRTYDDRRLHNPMRHLPGYVVVHLDSVIAGLNFPLHSFHLELFRALEIVPAQFGYAKRIAGLGIQNLRLLVAEPFKARAGLGASVCTCIVLSSLRCYGSERLGSFCAGVFPSTSTMGRTNNASTAAGREHKDHSMLEKPLVPKVESRMTRARADDTSGAGASKRPRVESTASKAIIVADDSDGEPGSPLKRKPTSRNKPHISPPRNSDVRRLRDEDVQTTKSSDDARPTSPPETNGSSLGLIEFSGVGPRKESMMLFGQTTSSIWCGLNLKVPSGLRRSGGP
ncbi:unnamed protein product [Cuscuta epithymum]|uniref:Uncharacterized protein n=1 Tax=Cuscuta epithymum TaxID=186058 RepID=A0AAV0D169_9ASTE|nr:unnamed protein product [Cuscuta epithymum]